MVHDGIILTLEILGAFLSGLCLDSYWRRPKKSYMGVGLAGGVAALVAIFLIQEVYSGAKRWRFEWVELCWLAASFILLSLIRLSNILWKLFHRTWRTLPNRCNEEED